MSASTTSLPSYLAPTLSRAPSYAAEPQAYEQRLAWNQRDQRPPTDFVKQSKSGVISLRLVDQEQDAVLPVYGCGATIAGEITLSRTDSIVGVEVKIEGTLQLKEVAEGGTTSHTLCLSRVMLWNKDRDFMKPCPTSLPFSLDLPFTFNDGREDYPLPPTHEVHLSGVPGFRATIEYSVSAFAHKPTNKATNLASSLAGNLNWHLIPLKNGSGVSTRFIYFPRSRPATIIPPPLVTIPRAPGFLESPDWKSIEYTLKAKVRSYHDINVRLWLPTSKVFYMRDTIPFHLSFISSSQSLTAFMPFAPSVSSQSSKRPTQIQVLRQSTVDVRNALVLGTKTDIWRVVAIGEGIFRHTGDGADFMSYSGEVRISDDIKIGGFKAGGLFIKDCIVFSVQPSDLTKFPFTELRTVVPIRLTTDPWSVDDGSGIATPPPTISHTGSSPSNNFSNSTNYSHFQSTTTFSSTAPLNQEYAHRNGGFSGGKGGNGVYGPFGDTEGGEEETRSRSSIATPPSPDTPGGEDHFREYRD